MPAGAVFKQVAIACQHCDAILSTTDYFDTNEQVSSVRAEVETLQSKMDSLEKGLRDIDQLLRQFTQNARP